MTLLVVSSLVGLATPFLTRMAIDDALPARNVRLLAVLVGGMVAVTAATSVFGVLQTWMSTRVGQQVMHRLRTEVFSHLQKQSLAFFTRTKGGEVQSRLTNDVNGMQSVVTDTATSIATNVTTVVATAIAMVALSWRLSLLTLLVLPPAVFLTRRVAVLRRQITARQQRQLSTMLSQVEEGLTVSGVRLTKTMGATRTASDRFTDTSRELVDLEVASQLAGRWRMSTMSIIFAVIPALLYLAAGLPLTSGGMTIGTLVAFVALQASVFRPIMGLLNTSVQVVSSMALFSRIFGYLDLTIDIPEPTHPVAVDPRQVRGDLGLSRVGYRYPGTDRDALADISITVPAGQSLALVGETGSGKSTLAGLIARLADPTTGSISVDGVDLRDMSLETVADSSVWSPRRPTCCTPPCATTCATPSRTPPTPSCGRRCTSPRSASWSRPCRTVWTPSWEPAGSVSPVVSSSGLPSPGPCCATRASWCWTKPRARWTTRRSANLQSALDALAAGRTTVTIAHRLSTIRDADQIVVLDHGQVIETGTHAELVASGGRYAQLAAADELSPASPTPIAA